MIASKDVFTEGNSSSSVVPSRAFRIHFQHHTTTHRHHCMYRALGLLNFSILSYYSFELKSLYIVNQPMMYAVLSRIDLDSFT
jgi:hypothetical protein